MAKNMLLCVMLIVPKNKRNPEVFSGIFLILGSIFLGLSFLTKVEFISFFNSVSDDFEYLFNNVLILQINSLLLIASGFILAIVAATLMVSIKIHHETLGFLTGFFFFFTTVLISIAGIKGLNIIELIAYQNNNILDSNETSFVNISIFNLTRENAILLRFAGASAGIGIFFIGLFGFISKRIPFLIKSLCILGGLFWPTAVILYPGKILNEVGMILFLLSVFLLGIRLSFKGFVLHDKRNIISPENDENT